MIGWRPFACLAFSVAIATGGAALLIAGTPPAGAAGQSVPGGHSPGAVHKPKPGKLHISVSPAAGTPAETVSPDTGLVNGQSVTVSVTGFPANVSLAVVECAPPATQQSFCNTGTVKFIGTNGSGAGSTPFTVTTGKQGTDPSSICPPQSGDCQITAATFTGSSSAFAYIEFASQTTTTTSTTSTTVASGGTTTTVASGGTTSTVASGGSTTTAGSGGGSSPSSSSAVATGSGSSTSTGDPLANTGTPADTFFVAILALFLIAAGFVATVAARRRHV